MGSLKHLKFSISRTDGKRGRRGNGKEWIEGFKVREGREEPQTKFVQESQVPRVATVYPSTYLVINDGLRQVMNRALTISRVSSSSIENV